MGKGGGEQHTPYEAPNNLTSRQKLAIVDLISEGPIEGPVNGLQAIQLNDTPAVDASGQSNVNGMVAQWRAGTLEQPVMEGFTDSASETPVGVEIKNGAPVTRTITTQNIDRLRLTFGTQALVRVTDEGDRLDAAVQLAVQVQRNGQWVTEKDVTISGKRSNSPFLTPVTLNNLPPRPFSVRLVRVSPDSHSDKLQNSTFWSSYSEITDIAQSYPGSAVVGLTFDSAQFGNQFPRRNYRVKGRIIQVPANYDPQTRQYQGLWDGRFKPAWSDNPAWVLYDLLTHPRYGMGHRLGVSEVDKFALYMIGQYCDQTVPDGFGGQEPRMRCNAYLTDLRKAYDIVSELCAMMRAMPVWDGRRMTFIQDRPADVVWPYTNANVVGGTFGYTFSALKARHSVVEVRFIDPDNGWKTSVEPVSDDAMVARTGRNVLRVDAFGCTSRGQAHRHGLWILTTEKLETQCVEFAVGAEGLRHMPGDIIEIADNDYVDVPIGGRLVAVDEKKHQVTLDRAVEKPPKGQSTLTLMDNAGQPVRLTVTGYPAPTVLEVDGLLSGIRPQGVWALSLPSLRRRLFRAISISDNGDGTFTVSAVQHVPEKEAIVDNGARFDPKPETSLGNLIPPAEHLAVEVTADSEQWQVEATWDTPYAVRGIRFALKLTQGGRIVGTTTTPDSHYRFGGLPQGAYTLTVTPQNTRGQRGEPSAVDFAINPPPAPTHIEIEPGYFSLGVRPMTGGKSILRPQYEFWFSQKAIADIDAVTRQAQYLGTGPLWVVQGPHIKPNRTFYFYVRSVNVVGKSAFVEASGSPRDDAAGILDVIKNDIVTSEAWDALSGQVNSNTSGIIETALANNADMQRWRKENGERKAEILEVRTTLVDETQAFAEKLEHVSVKLGENEAAIKTKATTVFKQNGDGKAIHSVEAGVIHDGKYDSAGIAIGAEVKDGQVKTQVLFEADRLALLNRANGQVTVPFVVQNGQVFINEAFINDGTIGSAKIAERIQSKNWDGQNGWYIDKGGQAHFGTATVRGKILAESGELNNVRIRENCSIEGTLSVNHIVGDIYNAQSGGVHIHGPYLDYFSWSSHAGEHAIWNISGEEFDRVLDSNITLFARSNQRQVFNLFIRTPGKADVDIVRYDTGNDGDHGPLKYLLQGIRLPAAGRNANQMLMMSVAHNRTSQVSLRLENATPSIRAYRVGRVIATSASQ